MNLSKSDRKKLRKALEEAIPSLSEGDNRKLLLITLALIKDLDAKERLSPVDLEAISPREDGLYIHKHIQYLMEEFQEFELPAIVDEKYLQYFSVVADSLERLSEKVNDLQELLVRIHAEGVALEETHRVYTQ